MVHRVNRYCNAKEDAKLLECITHPQAFALFRGQSHREDFLSYCRQAGQIRGAVTKPKAGAEYNVVLDKLTERLGIDDVLGVIDTPESIRKPVGQEGGLAVPTYSSSEHRRMRDMSATTFEVANFAIEVARFPMGERLYNACLVSSVAPRSP